jgi:hypothetical protein
MSPAEWKMQPTIQEKPDVYRLHVQVYVQMYCGLHFLNTVERGKFENIHSKQN